MVLSDVHYRDHLSYSAIKQFERCEESAVVGFRHESKAFLEGQFFEAVVTQTLDRFLSHNDPEVFFKADKRTLKAPFAAAKLAAERLRSDPDIRDIIDRCDKQVKLEGEIDGIPYIGYADLMDPKTHDCYDFKYVRDFGGVWDVVSGVKLEWFRAYRYDWQAAIYRQLSKGGKQHLIAATKEAVPDVGFWQFDSSMLDRSLRVVELVGGRFWDTVNGKRTPQRCEQCEYCRTTKRLRFPELIV